MKPTLRVVLLCSSKKAVSKAKSKCPAPDDAVEEPPPDQYAEYDSDATLTAVEHALSRRYQVTRLEGDVSAFTRLKNLRPDLVFNICEGFCGPNREAHVPIMCEMLGLPYTGSDALTLSLCLDKARAKEIMLANGLATPAFLVMDENTPAKDLRTFPLPAIIKPLREGSSMGIRDSSLVRSRQQLVRQAREIIRTYRQPALAEVFLPGREFTVGILGNGADCELLPIVEINHKVLPAGANPIYGYEAKWVWDDPANPLPMLICPAKISARLERAIYDLVRRALRVFDIKDWCRLDVRLDAKGRPHILELNPLPGILPDASENSALPAAARAAGYGYEQLILRVAEAALRRVKACPGKVR